MAAYTCVVSLHRSYLFISLGPKEGHCPSSGETLIFAVVAPEWASVRLSIPSPGFAFPWGGLSMARGAGGAAGDGVALVLPTVPLTSSPTSSLRFLCNERPRFHFSAPPPLERARALSPKRGSSDQGRVPSKPARRRATLPSPRWDARAFEDAQRNAF